MSSGTVLRCPAKIAALTRAHSGILARLARSPRKSGRDYLAPTRVALMGLGVATFGRNELGDGGLWLGLLPIVLAAPFALPWLDPPAEHGTLQLLAFLVQKIACNVTWLRLPPRHELAEADGLRAFLRVLNADG